MSQTLLELDGPTDCITTLQFSPGNPAYLLATSWDGHVRLYDVPNKLLVRDFATRAPVLDAAFLSETRIVTAAVDGAIRSYDLEQGCVITEKTYHKSAIRSLVYSQPHGILVAGSWDCSLSIHLAHDAKKSPIYIRLPEKVFGMSGDDEHLIVAMSNRQFHVYSFSQFVLAFSTGAEIKPLQRRESSLKFMTRAVQCSPSAGTPMAGYVSTSIEGRVAVEFFDTSDESQGRKYAFKCHRQKGRNQAGEEEDVVYAVNAIEFHPVHRTFASAGGDGVISVWDLKAKKRVKQYATIGHEIQALAFSSDARYLAMGTGVLGVADQVSSGKILVRELSEGECKGKS